MASIKTHNNITTQVIKYNKYKNTTTLLLELYKLLHISNVKTQ